MHLRGRSVLIGILALILIAVFWLRWGRLGDPEIVEAAPLPAPIVPEGQNGLSPAERERFYHLSEGDELYPLDWILALEGETTTPDGRAAVRPFLEERRAVRLSVRRPASPPSRKRTLNNAAREKDPNRIRRSVRRARRGKIRGYQRPQGLSREDVGRHLGNRPISAQRVSADHPRSLEARGRPPRHLSHRTARI